MKTAMFTGMGALALWAVPAVAEAAQYTICVRLPVSLIDETGAADEIGTSTPVIGSGGWIARGIHIDHVDRVGVGPVANVPSHAGIDSGCFTMEAAGGAQYAVFVRSEGELDESNTLRVSNDSGTPTLYSAVIDLPAGGGTFVLNWPQESILLRMYAIYAYAIGEGYRGRYNDETLHAFWYVDSETNTHCNGDCLNCARNVNGSLSYLCIRDSSDQRKFLLAHEYGHANLWRSLGGITQTDDCGYDFNEPAGVPSSWHAMTSLERDSCAFSEGWAHFVAADMWNDDIHLGGDPGGSFRYWGPDEIIDLEAGQGGCGDYPIQYADSCYGANANCSGGDCDRVGVELDWLRTLWDFHTDGDLPGAIPDHIDVQDAIGATNGWNATNFWDRLMAGLSGSVEDRMQAAADANGTSEP